MLSLVRLLLKVYSSILMDMTQLFLRAQYCEPGIRKQRPTKGCIKMEFRGNPGNLEATSRVAPVRTQS